MKELLIYVKDAIEVILLIIYPKLRWAYFHLDPKYVKFTMEGTEFHFQNLKTGAIESQIIIVFNEDSIFYKKPKDKETKNTHL